MSILRRDDSAGPLPPLPAWRRWGAAVLVLAAIELLNLAAWRALAPSTDAPAVAPRVAGLAYNAFQRWESPLAQDRPDPARLEADVRILAGMTSRLRTYSTLELPDLPALAGRYGLELTAGAWLDSRADHNDREVEAVIAAARQHRHVTRVIAGNETQLHGTVSFAALAAHLDRLRRELDVPVSTAEPWHVWLRRPELARHVDFITVHLLPYWERVPVEGAVDEALRRYDEVRRRFPGTPVVIGEIGWPSGGDRLGLAQAGPAEQALFIRHFLARVAGAPPDYYLMEAVDQPWKRVTEGPAGPHWGLLDAQRVPKFDWSGPVVADPYAGGKAIASGLLGAALALPLLLAASRWRWPARLALGVIVQAVVSLGLAAMTVPLDAYLRPLDLAVLALLMPLLVLTAAMLLAQGFEFAELYWDGALRRRLGPRPPSSDRPAAFVSVHLACSREPPAMVIDTLERLRALDWPAFEVVVVDNNTPDPADWEPVAAHVEAIERSRAEHGGHGPRVRFVRQAVCPGFKAEALNIALAHTDPRATWIGVVDADYRVEPGWLAGMAGHFEDPQVAVVQAPQAHRDGRGPAWRRWMHWEYEGFFRLGMHHRHERNALVQHGTMALVRRSALEAVGGWSSSTLCEDTELGLRLLAEGHRLAYVDRPFGAGLLPADLAAYRRQRERWAQGAMQILRRHAATLLGRSRLTLAQRYHFVAGWLPWIGDALHLAFSLLALAWTVALLLAPGTVGVPALAFLVPLAVFFVVRVIAAPLLYARRVGCGAGDIVGAAIAGVSLSHPIARGVWAGLAGRSGTFVVTRKGVGATGAAAPRRDAGLREERALLGALLGAAGAVAWQRPAGDPEHLAWIAVLLLQAMPYAAALILERLSRRAPMDANPARSVPQRRRAGPPQMALADRSAARSSMSTPSSARIALVCSPSEGMSPSRSSSAGLDPGGHRAGKGPAGDPMVVQRRRAAS